MQRNIGNRSLMHQGSDPGPVAPGRPVPTGQPTYWETRGHDGMALVEGENYCVVPSGGRTDDQVTALRTERMRLLQRVKEIDLELHKLGH